MTDAGLIRKPVSVLPGNITYLAKGTKMNTFKTSANGRKFIELWEGTILTAYNDGTGVWTIGTGHTTAAGPPTVVPGMRITADQADAILTADLASVEIDVNRLVTATLNQNQFDALVSFHYNTGALGRSNVLRAINSNELSAVPADLNMWVMGGGRVMEGLVKRRRAEGVLFNTGTIVGP